MMLAATAAGSSRHTPRLTSSPPLVAAAARVTRFCRSSGATAQRARGSEGVGSGYVVVSAVCPSQRAISARPGAAAAALGEFWQMRTIVPKSSIIPKFEVIRAIILEDSPCCGASGKHARSKRSARVRARVCCPKTTASSSANQDYTATVSFSMMAMATYALYVHG